jgi:hypothetical protein
MADITNNLVRQFYLGDYSAWDTLMNLHSNSALRFLIKNFPNLPEGERDELVAKFAVNFYLKVKKGHEEAEKQIGDSARELSADEIDALKIQCCTVSAKFDLSYGYNFTNWMFKRLDWDAKTALERLNLKPEFIQVNHENENFLEQLNHPSEQGELKDINVIKRILKEVLEGDERIYLDVWFDHGPDPKARLVKDSIAEKTGRTVGDAYVTNLKQRFLAKSYLELLEHINRVSALASLCRTLMEVNESHEKMFVVMMENIWKAFYEDDEAVLRSQTGSSPKLWARWQNTTQRKNVQEEILVEAYRYFRHSSPLLKFCYKIELYANTHFGSRIRQLFMEGGGKK